MIEGNSIRGPKRNHDVDYHSTVFVNGPPNWSPHGFDKLDTKTPECHVVTPSTTITTAAEKNYQYRVEVHLRYHRPCIYIYLYMEYGTIILVSV